MELRGFCSVCGYSWRVLKDGTIQSHHLWSGGKRIDCKGSRTAPDTSVGAGRK